MISQVAKNLQAVFKRHDVKVPLTDEMLEQFAKFYKFLMEYNQKYNLTRLKTFEEVAVKHFVDCLYVLHFTELPEPLIDMGSGAGFPGIPLKIAKPDLRIILVEGVQKKVEYLKELREHLGLKKLDIIGRNVEPKMHYPVQGVITRAVEVISGTLKNTINCVQTGGKVILMKTPGIHAEIKEAQEISNYELILNKDYRLGPSEHERKILVYQKVKL